jgi:hypothetical protein
MSFRYSYKKKLPTINEAGLFLHFIKSVNNISALKGFCKKYRSKPIGHRSVDVMSDSSDDNQRNSHLRGPYIFYASPRAYSRGTSTIFPPAALRASPHSQEYSSSKDTVMKEHLINEKAKEELKGAQMPDEMPFAKRKTPSTLFYKNVETVFPREKEPLWKSSEGRGSLKGVFYKHMVSEEKSRQCEPISLEKAIRRVSVEENLPSEESLREALNESNLENANLFEDKADSEEYKTKSDSKIFFEKRKENPDYLKSESPKIKAKRRN